MYIYIIYILYIYIIIQASVPIAKANPKVSLSASQPGSQPGSSWCPQSFFVFHHLLTIMLPTALQCVPSAITMNPLHRWSLGLKLPNSSTVCILNNTVNWNIVLCSCKQQNNWRPHRPKTGKPCFATPPPPPPPQTRNTPSPPPPPPPPPNFQFQGQELVGDCPELHAFDYQLLFLLCVVWMWSHVCCVRERETERRGREGGGGEGREERERERERDLKCQCSSWCIWIMLILSQYTSCYLCFSPVCLSVTGENNFPPGLIRFLASQHIVLCTAMHCISVWTASSECQSDKYSVLTIPQCWPHAVTGSIPKHHKFQGYFFVTWLSTKCLISAKQAMNTIAQVSGRIVRFIMKHGIIPMNWTENTCYFFFSQQ